MLLRRRTAGVAVVALLVIAGCASSPSRSEPPPPAAAGEKPAPSAEPTPPVVTPPVATPKAVTPKVDRVDYSMFINLPNGSGYTVPHMEITGQHAKVPTLPFNLRLELKPWPQADFRSKVQVTGGGTVLTDWTFTGAVDISFPEGSAGSVLSVTLPEIDGMESVTYHLERTEPVKMTAEVQVNDAWVPAQPDQVYPAESAQVRLTFDRPMDRPGLEHWLQHTAWPSDRPNLEGIEITWPDDRTVLVRLPKAPPVVAWTLTQVRGTDGLPLVAVVPALHFGEQPFLVAIDPATGEEERLTALPVEVGSGTVSPNGKSLLLEGIRHQTVGHSHTGYSRWLVGAGTQTKPLPFEEQRYLYFSPDGRLQSLEQREGARSYTASPDGTRIAHLYMDGWGKQELPGYLYPHDLVIQSPDGQVVQVVRQAMSLYAPPKDYPLRATLVWSPDGKRIATLTDAPEGQGAIVVIDLATGQAERIATLPPEMGRGAPYPFFWNGEHFVVGKTLFDSAGKVKRELPGSGPFSPDGKWLLFQRGVEGHWDPAWGAVGLLSVDTGEVKPLGEGMVLGWRSDGKALVARWTDWRFRYGPMEL